MFHVEHGERRTTYFLDLFAGIGGFALGAERADLRFDAHYFSEVDDYATRVYSARFPDAVALGDIRNIRGADLPQGDWIIAGGFPCQDISVAGKGAGLAGERSGLWYEYARLIGELRPRFAIMENVGALAFRGLDSVLGSLAALGYDAEWQDIRASDVGAPHRRERLWIVGYPCGSGLGGLARGRPGAELADGHLQLEARTIPDANRGRCEGERERRILDSERAAFGNDVDGCGSEALADADREPMGRPTESWCQRGSWAVEPDVGRVAHGIPARVDRLKCLGNSIVPQIAELIFSQSAFDEWRTA
jgi:DNA (cytosine-5)-methyltransferase 1